METIHLKTVDPVSQELLRLAAQKGIALNWDRYEKLQPQDGFLRLGLSCPFGCLQGPCRIDPFGRGADRGLCGMDRDRMAAAMLLRICLHGILTILNDSTRAGKTPAVSFAPAINKAAAKASRKVGVKSLSTDEIYKGAALLQRPSASFEVILDQTLALSLLAVGLSSADGHKGKGKNRAIRAGYGVLSGGHTLIAVAGRPPVKLTDALAAAAARKSDAPLGLISLGEWIAAGEGFLPIACSSAEAELLISSHAIHTLVAGQGADPGVIETARKLNVPVAASGDKADAAKILKSARQFHSRAPRPEVAFTPDLSGEGTVSATFEGFTGPVRNQSKARLALLGGSDSLHYPLGHLPVALAMALRGAGLQVAGWGDAAVWMVKSGLASGKDQDRVGILDPCRGPLQVFEEPAPGGKGIRPRGILFTGSRDCRDLPVALGLAMLGCCVALADPVPCRGSREVRDRLDDRLAANGGRLTDFDHPAEVQELLQWFTR